MTDNNNNWPLISRLFDQLQDEDGDAVDAAVRKAEIDSNSEELLRRMLRAHREEHFLDRSVDELASELLDGAPVDTQPVPEVLPGEKFGPWQVTREIERGGMGAVLAAERADGQFEKTVALKIIKPGHYSNITKERFLAEMRILARLEHPNIVRLIDGGINNQDLPWFAMEFVEGSPITDHADRNKLSLRARVRLLIEACKAVEHAHRNLVVHGDLKPSNILVTQRGQVRLVDFGIARSLQDDDPASAIPRFSPRYASPELADGQAITTASDVFGLCAVLYELICGLAPRELVSTTTQADYRSFMLTPIPNVGDQYDNSTSARKIAAQRATNIRRLKRSLKGDLHWILNFGLQVSSGKRLSSAAELRQDLVRYLKGLPVESHPPSNTYYFGKFLRRFRVPVIAGTAAVVALGASAAIASRQAELANQEAEKALWSSSFLMRIFDEADPWRNQLDPITVNALAAAAVVDVLENRRDLAPDTLSSAASILARVEGRLGHYDSSEKLLNLRIELLEQEGRGQADLAKAFVELGIVESNQSENEAAITAFRRAASILPVSTPLDETAVNAAIQLAYALTKTQEVEEAREVLDVVLEREDEITILENRLELMASMYNTSSTLLLLEGDIVQARNAAERAMEFAEAMDSDVPIMIATSLLNLAEAFHQAGESEAALELDRKVVDIFSNVHGLDHPQTLESQGRLAVSTSNLGRMEEAISAYQEVLKGQIDSLGPANQYVAATLGNIGAAYLALGEDRLALQYYNEAQPVWESEEPAQPVYVAINKIGVARSLHGLQRMQESDEAFSSALHILEAATGTSHPIYSRAEVYRAPLLLDLNRLVEAAEILPGAYKTISGAYGPDSKHTAVAGLRWAQLMVMTGDSQRASELATRSVSILDTDANRRRYAADLDQARELLVTTQQ